MAPDKLADGKKKSGPKPQVLGIFLVFIMVAMAGGIIVYSLSDWSAPAKAKAIPNPIPATPEAIGAGMSIYMDRCQNCHGEDGNGRGERAEKLSVAPADFTDAQAMSAETDGELFWKISEGHRPMPAFEKKLSAEQRWQLVDYIRTFRQAVNAAPSAAPPAAPEKGAVPK